MKSRRGPLIFGLALLVGLVGCTMGDYPKGDRKFWIEYGGVLNMHEKTYGDSRTPDKLYWTMGSLLHDMKNERLYDADGRREMLRNVKRGIHILKLLKERTPMPNLYRNNTPRMDDEEKRVMKI